MREKLNMFNVLIISVFGIVTQSITSVAKKKYFVYYEIQGDY